LSNDVPRSLERCVVGAYQVGYIFDYLSIEDKEIRQSYFEEGIASILLHTISVFEMLDIEIININDNFLFNYNYKWNNYVKEINLYKKNVKEYKKKKSAI
jgi:hypothetical protein